MATELTSPPFGRDTSATDRINYGRIVTAGELLAEAAYRRLTTVRGTLLDDLSYGLCVSLWLGRDVDDSEIASYPGQIESELMKDPRLASVAITVTPTRGDSGRVELDIDIDGFGANRETFELSLHVNDVTVEILGIGGTNG